MTGEYLRSAATELRATVHGAAESWLVNDPGLKLAVAGLLDAVAGDLDAGEAPGGWDWTVYTAANSIAAAVLGDQLPPANEPREKRVRMLDEVAKRLESEIRPLLGVNRYRGGYDCCGCSTYDQILDHAIHIVAEARVAQTGAVE